MNAKGKLTSLERQAARSFGGTEPDEAERRQRDRDVHEWVEYRAGLQRRPLPPFLDKGDPIPPPDFPSASDIARDLWVDALDGIASFSARVARRLRPDEYQPDASERAKRLCDLHAAYIFWVLRLLPGDEPVWFFPAHWFAPADPAAPPFTFDTIELTALKAVGVWWAGESASYFDGLALSALLKRAEERSRSV